MHLNRRTFLAATVATGTAGLLSAQSGPDDAFRPEAFGARGDGRTDDTDAFAAMSDAVNRRGGGTIVLARATYIVGRQFPPADRRRGFYPARILELSGLRQPLRIVGNGARLKCAPGLRFGTFDRANGRAVTRAMPNYRAEETASPYIGMVVISGCQAPVEISDLELDGNLAGLQLGGPYGDVGFQIPGTGLVLRDNRSTETIRNLRSHHHALDGLLIDGDPARRARSRLERVRCEDNGRQGVSIVGGRGYDFAGCAFNRNGRGRIASAPAAGVDIEAENGKQNRDFTFAGCEFLDNGGCGVVADSGDSADAVFRDCTFAGTRAWAAWPRKPRFRFEDCTFVGAISNAFPSEDPAAATKFARCTFTDDPARAPGGRVFVSRGGWGPIADLNTGRNVRFDDCRFILTREGLLPWSTQAIFNNCTMSQRSARPAYPRGTYLGRNTIRGNVDLHGSQLRGEVVVNGVRRS